MNLTELGWNDFFQQAYEAYKTDFEIGRVSIVHRNLCRVITEHGEVEAAVSRKLQEDIVDATGRTGYHLREISRFPAVGDWALLNYSKKDGKALLRGVLPTQTRISRNDPGKATDEQVIAANVDTVLLIMAVDYDFNLRRVERYLTILKNSGVNPVIILNKADLVEETASMVIDVRKTAIDVPVHVMAALENRGVEEIRQYFVPGRTCIFLGSSGVGKTTILNRLLGEDRYRVQEISDYRDKGRHTTSSRKMIILENGGILIDTPGLRRIDLWSEQDGYEDIFTDIIELSKNCHFRNCTHSSEPGCAIRKAISSGKLAEKRVENYLKLQEEMAYAERKNKYRRHRRARISYKKSIRKDGREQQHERDD